MRGMRSMWRAAGCALMLAAATVLGGAVQAQADPVVAQSANVSLAASGLTVQAGGTVTFTVSVTNDTGSATYADGGVYLEASLFQDVSCAAVTGPTPVCIESSGSGSVSYNAWRQVPANSTAVATVTATIKANAVPGTYAVQPSGSFGGYVQDFTPASLNLTVTGTADLAVGLTAASGLGSITYTQTTTNNGPATATGTAVTTTLPGATTSVTALPADCVYDSTAKAVTCTVNSLANGTAATRTFTAHIGALALGSLPATATRTAGAPQDPDPANNTATATCNALTGLIITC
ncbi:hypothetical protein WN990_24505 [Kitasatospora purpeofusca]|uniref:hypothetical protein n=1 Tax=Kitasatospora purpeofusca TaxID=67352 RepID=UPI0030F0EBB6